MKVFGRSLGAALLGTLTAMGVACAHAPASMQAEGGRRSAAPEKVVVTGSHIRQTADPATGGVPTMSTVRTYSRDQIVGTGRQADIPAALRSANPDLSP